jgi:hypothetical protein
MMARWKIYVAGPPGRREEGSEVLEMELPLEHGTAGSAVAYHAAKELRRRGRRVSEDRILALPSRGDPRRRRDPGRRPRADETVYFLSYGRALSMPYRLREMAETEARALSRPDSYGGDVLVVERTGAHTREVAHYRHGQLVEHDPVARVRASSRAVRARERRYYGGPHGKKFRVHRADHGTEITGPGAREFARYLRTHRADPRRLTYAERQKKPSSEFALPKRRKLWIGDKTHVRNAAARLAQMKKRGTVTAAEYAEARKAIERAGRRHGVGKRRRHR